MNYSAGILSLSLSLSLAMAYILLPSIQLVILNYISCFYCALTMLAICNDIAASTHLVFRSREPRELALLIIFQ